jgi:hypothetical protein
MTLSKLIASVTAGGALALLATGASATSVVVTITNNAPTSGVYLTPVWSAFHNGTFDTFSAGSAASAGLEALSEDGNVAGLSKQFATEAAGGVQGVTGAAPIAPGQSVSQTFTLADDGSNSFFSYASMVLPSSDYFVGNDNAQGHSIQGILDGLMNEIVFNIGLPGGVYDAGTEVNDFATSAGNGLFAGIPGGQSGPNQGADEGGLVTAVADPFADFLSAGGLDLTALDFGNTALYGEGIATVRISVVPIPAALPLFAAGLGALGFLRRR